MSEHFCDIGIGSNGSGVKQRIKRWMDKEGAGVPLTTPGGGEAGAG